MDPATVIVLCKENIQPLRHGRNATHLGTALRAQEDPETQELLNQEKRKYEDAIKNYDGDDPLENWYEYILWVEQSYPKGPDIGKLLQQCLAAFEKDTKYLQDRRYIRLWINYTSMQKNPLELYQLLYNSGIGTMVADMYRAWAFELELVDDSKKAEEVYRLGIACRAEPQDELKFAHDLFQLAVGRKTLGCVEERNEISLSEQRQAFSSLRAIKAGKGVTSVRTGHRVRDFQPGVVPQSTLQMQAKSGSKIQIYEDECGRADTRGTSILDHVPIEETVHKENTLKPGPWSNLSRKHPLIPSGVRPAFKVHEDLPDENMNMEKPRLFPNHISFFDGSKYPEHMAVPVFVTEPPSANVTKPHYPKELVYANNIDRSMEEIRAERYLNCQRNHDRHCDANEVQLNMSHCLSNGHESNNQGHEADMQEIDRMNQEKELVQKQLELEHQRRETEKYELQQRLAAEELERQQFEAEKREKERLEAEQQEIRRKEQELEQQRRQAELVRQQQEAELERQRREAELERQRRAAELEQQRRDAELERQHREAEFEIQRQKAEIERIEAERIEAEHIESQRMEAELSRQSKLQSSNFMHHSSSGAIESGVDQLLSQSMTVNTKEAMSVVQDLWQSPNSSNNSLMASPMSHRMVDSRAKFSFDIHVDSSMTQEHAMSSSRHHPSYNIQPYHDQENHQHYSSPYNPPQEHHQSYRNHGMPDPYHYQVPQPVEQPVQHDHRLQAHHLHQSPQLPPQQHLGQPHNMMHHQAQHHQHHSISQSQLLPHHPQISPHIPHHPPTPHVQSPHQMHHSSTHPAMHPMYNNMHPNNVDYHQSYSVMHPPLQPEPKQLHFGQFGDPQTENDKAYRRSELPYIKSPGMNRRDLKFLESADNKENASAMGYNTAIDENKQQLMENNLYGDESLGISPLAGVNESCYIEAFNGPLPSSTPMTNQFRPSTCRAREVPHYQQQPQAPQFVMPQPQSVIPAVIEPEDKLSIIMESTREYGSSSSGSRDLTRTTQFGFTMTREDLVPIREQSISQDVDSTEALLAANLSHDPKLRAQIQAMQAQSPRTMQRNVDQITSEIKNNCDLRIPFKLDSEPVHDEPMEEAEEEEFEIPKGDINPFDKGLISGLLRKIRFPQKHHSDGYSRINTNLNKFVPSTTITLGSDAFELEKCLGKGTYGTVLKAFNPQTGQTVALKIQKPAWVWEFYIAREIKARVKNSHMLRGFMDVTKAFVTNTSSVLVSEFSRYGTLLSVTNQVKVATGKPISEPIAIFFTLEMLQIIEYLHKCQIIHGDIKPDNFLLMHLPTEDVRPTLQLIDFGCSIDMTLLPEDTKFTQIIKTEDFTCIEMQTGRPWTYQTDLYCLAASAHCLLFGNYMRAVRTGDRWFITSKMPRYVQKQAWETFFTELLNIESCDKMPDLSQLRNVMEEAMSKATDVNQKLRMFSNVLKNR